MTTTKKITLPLESWLLMLQPINRILSQPYTQNIAGAVESAQSLIRLQRQIERARDDSGLEPIVQKAAKEFGTLNEKSQTYEFADPQAFAKYVAARRTVIDAEVELEVPMLREAALSTLALAERAVLAPLLD